MNEELQIFKERNKELEYRLMEESIKIEALIKQNTNFSKAIIVLQSLLIQAELHCTMFADITNQNIKSIGVCINCHGLGYINNIEEINKIYSNDQKLSKEEIIELMINCQCDKCNGAGFVASPNQTLH